MQGSLKTLLDRLPEGRLKQFYKHFGLRAIAVFVLFSFVVVFFAKLANEVREQDTLGFDRKVLFWVHDVSGSKFLDAVVPVTTNIGGTIGIIALFTLFVILFLKRRMYYRVVLLLFGTGGAVVLNLILKSMFSRVRPELWDRLVVENGFSFPSGHSMASSALAFSIIVVLWNTRWRVPAIVLGGLYMLYVGFTRLYLGVHYPSDVLGGWAVSFAWVLLVWLLFHRSRRATSHDRPQ